MSTIYVKGNAVPNATSYELFEKNSDGTYTSLGTNTEINFNISALGLAEGEHTFVVKAHADGYDSSDYSNELVWTYDDGVTNWEFYSQSDTATFNVAEDGSLTVTDSGATSSKACVLLASVTGDHSYTVPYMPSSAAACLIAIYSQGDQDYYFRCNGSSGTALQRYNHTTFSGAKVLDDTAATTVFTNTSKVAVKWSGNTASLYIDDVLITSYDMTNYLVEGGRKVAGVAWTFFAAGADNRTVLTNFTIG